MKYLDLFSTDIMLFSEGNKYNSTKLGGFVSIIISIMIIILIIAFGNDFYKRVNPSVIRETQITDFPIYNVTRQNFSVAIRIEDQNGIRLVNNDNYILRTYLYNFEKVNGQWTGGAKVIELVNCTQSMFSNKELFHRYGLDQFYCINTNDFKIGGSWSSDGVSYITFATYGCYKDSYITREDGVKEKCNTTYTYEQMQWDYIGYRAYMSMFYQQALISSSNYTNGIQYNLLNEYIYLDKTISVFEYYYFQMTKMITDYGWLIKEKRDDQILGFNRKKTSFFINKFTGNTILLAAMTTYLDSNIDLYSREYMKIQVLAANVGGIIKIFFLLAQFLMMLYNQTDFIFTFAQRLLKNDSSKYNIFIDKENNSNLINFNNSIVKLVSEDKIINENVNNCKNNLILMNNKQLSNQNELKENVVNEGVRNNQEFNKDGLINKVNQNDNVKLKQNDSINIQNIQLETNKKEDQEIDLENIKWFIDSYSSPFEYYKSILFCCSKFYIKKKNMFKKISNKTISLLDIKNFI